MSAKPTASTRLSDVGAPPPPEITASAEPTPHAALHSAATRSTAQQTTTTKSSEPHSPATAPTRSTAPVTAATTSLATRFTTSPETHAAQPPAPSTRRSQRASSPVFSATPPTATPPLAACPSASTPGARDSRLRAQPPRIAGISGASSAGGARFGASPVPHQHTPRPPTETSDSVATAAKGRVRQSGKNAQPAPHTTESHVRYHTRAMSRGCRHSSTLNTASTSSKPPSHSAHTTHTRTANLCSDVQQPPPAQPAAFTASTATALNTAHPHTARVHVDTLPPDNASVDILPPDSAPTGILSPDNRAPAVQTSAPDTADIASTEQVTAAAKSARVPTLLPMARTGSIGHQHQQHQGHLQQAGVMHCEGYWNVSHTQGISPYRNTKHGERRHYSTSSG